MAIATLDKVFSNEDVFTGVVKIRKGLACKLILESNDDTRWIAVLLGSPRDTKEELAAAHASSDGS